MMPAAKMVSWRAWGGGRRSPSLWGVSLGGGGGRGQLARGLSEGAVRVTFGAAEPLTVIRTRTRSPSWTGWGRRSGGRISTGRSRSPSRIRSGGSVRVMSTPPAVTLLWGEDPYLLREMALELVGERRATEVDANEWRGSELQDLATPSLFGEPRP